MFLTRVIVASQTTTSPHALILSCCSTLAPQLFQNKSMGAAAHVAAACLEAELFSRTAKHLKACIISVLTWLMTVCYRLSLICLNDHSFISFTFDQTAAVCWSEACRCPPLQSKHNLPKEPEHWHLTAPYNHHPPQPHHSLVGPLVRKTTALLHVLLHSGLWDPTCMKQTWICSSRLCSCAPLDRLTCRSVKLHRGLKLGSVDWAPAAGCPQWSPAGTCIMIVCWLYTDPPVNDAAVYCQQGSVSQTCCACLNLLFLFKQFKQSVFDLHLTHKEQHPHQPTCWTVHNHICVCLIFRSMPKGPFTCLSETWFATRSTLFGAAGNHCQGLGTYICATNRNTEQEAVA